MAICLGANYCLEANMVAFQDTFIVLANMLGLTHKLSIWCCTKVFGDNPREADEAGRAATME
eukprot:182803-Lingulodinium_polyedra.AAC.1